MLTNSEALIERLDLATHCGIVQRGAEIERLSANAWRRVVRIATENIDVPVSNAAKQNRYLRFKFLPLSVGYTLCITQCTNCRHV